MNDDEMIVDDEEVRIWKLAALTYLKTLTQYLLLQAHGPIEEQGRD